MKLHLDSARPEAAPHIDHGQQQQQQVAVGLMATESKAPALPDFGPGSLPGLVNELVMSLCGMQLAVCEHRTKKTAGSLLFWTCWHHRLGQYDPLVHTSHVRNLCSSRIFSSLTRYSHSGLRVQILGRRDLQILGRRDDFKLKYRNLIK
jgi:hypothetical protein